MLNSGDFFDAPGTMAGPGMLLYLLCFLYTDLWQMQVEFSPVECSLCRLCVVSGDGELAPMPAR
jgi:hypothetical protein